MPRVSITHDPLYSVAHITGRFTDHTYMADVTERLRRDLLAKGATAEQMKNVRIETDRNVDTGTVVVRATVPAMQEHVIDVETWARYMP